LHIAKTHRRTAESEMQLSVERQRKKYTAMITRELLGKIGSCVSIYMRGHDEVCKEDAQWSLIPLIPEPNKMQQDRIHMKEIE
jgi:hypothetical protein